MTQLENLGAEMQDFLQAVGITGLTPIQQRSIPVIRSGGQNALLLAPTGSGKTEAALLPLLDRLHQMKQARPLFGFYIVYITPLRALNRDVFKRIENLCQHLGVSVAVRHGDTTQYARRKQAINPPNLLITTPESLQAILPGKRLRYHLKTVFAVVVDEIHELADSKRGVQLSLGMERLERLVGHPIERIGLSATVGNPEEVGRLLGGRRKPKTIWAGYGQREMDLRVEMPEPTDNLHPLATKLAYPLHSTARLQTIVNLISNHKSTIVFTNTRSFAEVLGAKMHLLKPPFEFDVHHGSLSRDARIKAEDRLKTGRSRGIVATSSLELGIDIGQADLVIQYSSPREVARFLQRAGRSGHGVGGKAQGIILSTVNLDDVTESGVIVRRARANKVENAEIPKKSWDVLGHQIAGSLLDEDEISRENLLELIKRSYPYAEVDAEELDRLLAFMESRRLLRQEEGLVKRHSRTRVFYYERLSTIPDIRQVQAVDMTTRTSIGVLDEDYVTANVEAGSVFVIRGRPWTVISVDEESGEVMCAPATGTNSDIPRWIGEMIPVPYEVASEVADVWASVTQSPKSARKHLGKEYGLDGPGQEHVIMILEQVREELGLIPTTSEFVIEDLGEGLVLHAPLGTRANETLGIVIASLLTTRLGFDVGVERDPYRILFTSTERIDPSTVTDVLEEYTEDQASHILKLAVKNTQNFASRFIHVARRMDIVRRDAKPRQIPVKRLIKSYEDSPLFDEAMREVLEEKMDEPRMRSVFRDYSNGKLEIHTVKTNTPSALARLIIEEKTRFEVMGEISEEEEVLRMMQERLLSRQFRLVCMAGSHWSSVRTVSTLEDEVVCPICGSKMIAVVSPSDESLKQILAKQLKGEELSKPEKKEHQQAALTAQLVALYGKTALMVLAGRGIGPKTASRILKPGHTERLEILRAIAKGEMEYERTRPYW